MATALKELSTVFKTKMNTTFGNCDKNCLPNIILIDDGMEFTNIRVFRDKQLTLLKK